MSAYPGRRVGVPTDWVTARISHQQHQVIDGELVTVKRTASSALT